MKHLSASEFVDYLDAALPAPRVAHLEDCAECRAHADSLRGALADVRRLAHHDAPEPSPLFWDHFSQRVQAAVHDIDPTAAPSHWFGAPLIRWASAGAVFVLAVAAILWIAPRSTDIRPVPAVATDHAAVAPVDDVALDLDNDEQWALVRDVADDLQWDDAHEAGLGPKPGSAERVALELSPAERRELARLIEDEIKHTGA